MPTPNQITACATATRQGIYLPEIHLYEEIAHPAYGLLHQSYYCIGKTRVRADAMSGMNREQMLQYLAEHAIKGRF